MSGSPISDLKVKNKRIELIWIGSQTQCNWPLGVVRKVQADSKAIHILISESLAASDAEMWLFWDGSLGVPDPEKIQKAMNLPGDVWHAGLRLGMGGLPGAIDFVQPTWMLNRDPNPNIEAISWRVSLRACLIRTEVLRQMGNILPGFKTLEAAALEMGHRYITRGVFVRHIPWMIASENQVPSPPAIPFEDELRFIYYRFGRFWTKWALGRTVLSRYISPLTALRAFNRVIEFNCPSQPEPYKREAAPDYFKEPPPLVSVLIPTLSRYSYLNTLLTQLRSQTIKPLEIIVVDQTPLGKRHPNFFEKFKDLPLRILYLDKPGQCSARNAGLKITQGSHILFLDDDDEIPADLIKTHLQNLTRFSTRVSSGVADEAGAGPLPENFRYLRISDVFPTNNTMILRDILRSSGLFDLAYDCKTCEDSDLGMRLYLGGELMILNPEISVLHHHALSGGLRTHKARVITYALSRSKLWKRNLPNKSEVYLAMRYFSSRQVREALWLWVFGTFVVRGNIFKKVTKFLIALILLPDAFFKIRRRFKDAQRMMKLFPQIPEWKGSGKP